MTPEFLNGLNDQQRAAVTAENGSILVLAGAGSGKTRVLTTRIAWLLSMSKVNSQEILAVTFTNKAAREMLLRIGSMLPYNLRGMWVGTFHGLCNRMLRHHHEQAALPESFQILDMQDQLSSIKRLMKNLNVNTDKIVPRQVQKFINSAKDEGLRPENIDDPNGFKREFIGLYDAYDSQCQKEGVVDFGELLLRSLELLRRSESIRKHYQTRFKHILVDEFQDTNSLQYSWLKLLSCQSTNVLAVGDDDQSIYAFRGANVANMQYFEKEFNVSEIIRLEQNYRSQGYILDAANALISKNTSRLGKNLWTDSGLGELIRVFESPEDVFEASWVVDEVKDFINANTSPSNIAILYRSNAQSRILEHELNKRGIDYRVYGGLRFYDRAEVKHALAYLRLLENKSDDNAFMRIVNFPSRKIGNRSLEQLQDIAKKLDLGLYDAIDRLEGKVSVALSKFKEMIESLRGDITLTNLPETVDLVIRRSGLEDFYLSEKNGSERLENLKELVTASSGFIAEERIDSSLPSDFGYSEQASINTKEVNKSSTTLVDENEFDAQPNLTPLAKFLANASLESGESQAAAGKAAVQLMTIHSAKGLEFDVVFVTGLEEGLFPHENSLSEVDGLEEERRLMYVALTRAKKRLFLSSAQTRRLHGQVRYHQQSRFLDEIPEECLKKLSLNNFNQHTRHGVYSSYQSGDYQKNYNAKSNSFSLNTSLTKKNVENYNSLKIGQSVRHQRFGDGVVVALQGSGSEASVHIKFKDEDLRCLSLAVAKLEKI